MRRFFLLVLLCATMLLGVVWSLLFQARAADGLEHEAFRVVDGQVPTTAELIYFCDQYPRTDAGGRLVTQAAICLGLSAHAEEFQRLRPHQFDEAKKIALGADEHAFGAAAELRLKAAKQSLRVTANSPGAR